MTWSRKMFLLICLILPVVGSTEQDPKKQILAAYDKAALGAEYKYIEGMLSNRADNFELLNPEGMLIDLSVERQRFAQLLEPASRVHLETKLIDFDCDAQHGVALCAVFQNFRTETFNTTTRANSVLSVKTYSRDWWVRRQGTWRLARSQVAQQTMGPGDPLPARKIDPTLFRKSTHP